MKSLQTHQVCLYSLPLLVLFICSNSASIYYEKPSSARLAAASQKPPACTYQNQKYQHGQQVPTAEPCLNCTCRKGNLLCFLRVCSTLIQSNPNDNCITVRESGQCCPTLKCETIAQNDISSPTTTIPTTKSLSGFSRTLDTQSLDQISNNTDKVDSSNGASSTTEATPSADSNFIHYSSDLRGLKPAEKSIETRNDNRVSVTQKDKMTTIFQTSPSTTFHESLLLVTSSPPSTLEDSNDNIITNSEGICHLNGTIYAEGSAVISTSFCEYCYCIRSKRMCIRPRCHLSILGCFPRYTSEYACCPTSYVCDDDAMTTLPMTTTTTTTTTTTMESVRLFGRKAACILNGIEYRVGEPIASDEHCKQCYCSTGGIKKCKKIQCSPEMEGCVPVIPEGHCCPVEYKCNSTLESTKSSEDIEVTTDVTHKSDLIPTTTEQNIKDSTEIGTTPSPTDVVSDTLTTLFETNEKLLIDQKINSNFSNSSETSFPAINEFSTESETISSLEVSDTKTETPLIQTENTINGQQMKSDDMILKMEENNSSLSLELYNGNNKTDTSVDSVSETTTDESVYMKNEIKPDLYSENKTLILNDIEITTQSLTTITSDVISDIPNPSLTSESSLNAVKNISFEKNDEFVNSVQNISLESLDVSTKTIIQNEDNDTKLSQNETSFDSVGVILQGIIHAIDKQIQRRIPAEPRLKNNSSDEFSETTNLNNSSLKPMTYRSENKAGPALSSSFFITDNNETPYKSDSDGVEIITAKTAFFDLYENPSDSILINLSPSSLKVGASGASPLNQNNNNINNNHNNNPSNDKKFDILGQNNRAAIYGRPANTPYVSQPYMPSNNDWRVVNSDFPRKPQFEGVSGPPKSIESLYYNQNNRRQDSDETLDQNNSDFDKRPRLEFENPMDYNNRMKVIPFKVNDAVAGLPHKRKNGSFLIRVSSPNKNSLAPNLPSKTNQQISCIFNNVEYPNGAMIPKSDPCTLCRCFYGRELCQQQKCPAPPEKDCVPEVMNGYCCPRYICRIIEDLKITPKPQPIDGFINSNPEPLNSEHSPIRNSPQFQTENKNNFNTNNFLNESHNEMTFPGVLPQNQENSFEGENSGEENRASVQSVVESVTPSPVLRSSPKPFQRISGMNSKLKPNENRIHFPIDKEIDTIVSQPFITDPISPFAQSNSRPSKPINPGSHHSQYNNANKFRLKPVPTMTQSVPPMSSFGSPQKPNLRLPPFLMHTHSGTNSPPANRQKPNTPSIPHSEDILKKSETINQNNSQSNISALNVTDSSNYNKSDPTHGLKPEYHSTTLSSESNNSMISVTVPSIRPSTTDSPSTSTTTKTTTTTDSKPKDQQINGLSEGNKIKNQNPWDLFRVSGCNIYGTMYEINTKIERISTSCKNCICSVQGVKCTDIC